MSSMRQKVALGVGWLRCPRAWQQARKVTGLKIGHFSWLGRQFWNQTFEDDIEVKIGEIWQLLDVSDGCGEEVG